MALDLMFRNSLSHYIPPLLPVWKKDGNSLGKLTLRLWHYIPPSLPVWKKDGNSLGKNVMHLWDRRELISAMSTPTVFPTFPTRLRKLCQSLLKYCMMSPAFSPLPVITIALIKSFKVPCWIINWGQNRHSSWSSQARFFNQHIENWTKSFWSTLSDGP